MYSEAVTSSFFVNGPTPEGVPFVGAAVLGVPAGRIQMTRRSRLKVALKGYAQVTLRLRSGYAQVTLRRRLGKA